MISLSLSLSLEYEQHKLPLDCNFLDNKQKKKREKTPKEKHQKIPKIWTREKMLWTKIRL
jgi:hypothetical protein